ncbi:MAG TPA: O-antigen ligase family protein [Solirubrobacteraceae bacterium]|nr:O-antigen ligase family protein [Solirubrobacteraceae bacterium]
MAVSTPILRARGAARATLATAIRARARGPLAPRALLLALLVLLAYAAFAHGAVQPTQESRLQVALALVALLACAAWLFGDGSLRLAATPQAWLGLGLLATLAGWMALSLAWSVAPDRTWIEFNRTLTYALVVLLAIAVGVSHPRAVTRLATGWLVIAVAVALYSLGEKVLPGLHVHPLFDLNQTGSLSRLRGPLQYWNALALVCAMAAPVALRLAADERRSRRSRLAAQAALLVLIVVIGLTYSRGGVIALAVGLLVVFVLVRHARFRAALLLGLALLAALPPLLFAFVDSAVAGNFVPLGSREGAGALLGLVLIVSLAGMLWLARRLIMRDWGTLWAPRPSRQLVRGGLAVVVTALLVLTVALGASDRGVAGAVSHQFHSFTATRGTSLSDPNRLLSTSSGNRWVWWREAVGAWSHHPWAGSGAGSFPVLHLQYRHNRLLVLQPHSVPLQFLAETGVIGALLALGGLGLLLFAAARAVRAISDRAEQALAATLLAAAIAWLVHGSIDWDWDIPGVTLPVLVFLGVLVGRATRAETMPESGGAGAATDEGGVAPSRLAVAASRSDALRALALAGAAALLCAFAISSALPAIAASKAGSALGGLPSKPTPAQLRDAEARARLAARLNPLSDEGLLAAAAIVERRGDVLRARGLILRAIAREPQDEVAWESLARLDFVRRDLEGVRRASERALVLNPFDDGVLSLARQAEANVTPVTDSGTATGTPLALPARPAGAATAPAGAALPPAKGATPSPGATAAPAPARKAP